MPGCASVPYPPAWALRRSASDSLVFLAPASLGPGPPNRLPTAHTCFNALLLPDYSSKVCLANSFGIIHSSLSRAGTGKGQRLQAGGAPGSASVVTGRAGHG